MYSRVCMFLCYIVHRWLITGPSIRNIIIFALKTYAGNRNMFLTDRRLSSQIKDFISIALLFSTVKMTVI